MERTFKKEKINGKEKIHKIGIVDIIRLKGENNGGF